MYATLAFIWTPVWFFSFVQRRTIKYTKFLTSRHYAPILINWNRLKIGFLTQVEWKNQIRNECHELEFSTLAHKHPKNLMRRRNSHYVALGAGSHSLQSADGGSDRLRQFFCIFFFSLYRQNVLFLDVGGACPCRSHASVCVCVCGKCVFKFYGRRTFSRGVRRRVEWR